MNKICFVVPRAYYLFNPKSMSPENMVGGSQKQCYLLSTGIAKNSRFDVHFCVADFGQPDSEIVENVKIHKSFNFNHNIFFRLYRLFKTLKKINADTYIFRAADSGVAISTLFLKFILRKKVLYMLASDAETDFRKLKKMLGLLTALTMPLTYKFADTITSQTQQQFNLFYKKRGRKPDALIKNIVNQSNIGINLDEKDNILWVGRLIRHKNPRVFIEMAENFPDEKFVMIAPKVSESSTFEDEIREFALKLANLQLIEYVNPIEIPDFYKKAKIYIMTSESEGFSNTMAEALSMGCAVVSYKVDNDQILQNYQMGFCASGNFELLKNQLIQLIENDELRFTFARNAMDYVREYHSADRIVEKFTELLLI